MLLHKRIPFLPQVRILYRQTRDSVPPSGKDTIPVIKTDTIPVSDSVPGASVDPELYNILNGKVPKKYVIQEIKVTGAKLFDPAIVISVSGLAVGDEVTLPGGDLFSKAINRLWTQNMFTNINIYITKLEGRKYLD
jgi:hypothetical protein